MSATPTRLVLLACVALFVVVSLGGAGGGGNKSPTQSGESRTTHREKWFGAFVPFPGSRMLCQQHVIGAGPAAPHITWALYATNRPPSEVRSFYAGHPGKERAEAPAELQLRVGKKLLVAYPASSSVVPRCGVKPKTTDKTAIVVSEFLSSDK